MILLVDAGNTRIKWGVRRADGWLVRGVCSTPEATRLRRDWAAYPVRHALLSCVADQATRATLAAALQARRMHVEWLQAAADAHGLHSRYRPPESLGADRYAALVAAARRKLGDCLVVSAGTALTVDALTAAGEFLGGAIAPGPDLMRAALLEGTAGVREMTAPAEGFPETTGEAVASGIALAQAGVVAALRERLGRHGRAPVTVLLSGGARATLAALLEAPLLEADDLVLEGLTWIAKDLKWEDC